MKKERAALVLLRKIGKSNLIGTDFADAAAKEVTKPNPGYKVCFTISHEAFGKIHDQVTGEALDTLLG